MNRERACVLLDELNDDETPPMNAWAIEFVDSLLKQSEDLNWRPTEKQAAKIKELHAQYVLGEDDDRWGTSVEDHF